MAQTDNVNTDRSPPAMSLAQKSAHPGREQLFCVGVQFLGHVFHSTVVLDGVFGQRVHCGYVSSLAIPSTNQSTVGRSAAITPGKETISQAQIFTELSKPFELVGLCGATDAGMFALEEVTMGDNTAEDNTLPQIPHAHWVLVFDLSLTPGLGLVSPSV